MRCGGWKKGGQDDSRGQAAGAASGKMVDLIDPLLSSSYQTLTDTKGPCQIDMVMF